MEGIKEILMASLEQKIRGIVNSKKKDLKEDSSGVVSTSQHVSPDWVDLGSGPTDPYGALPDYTKGITPGQAALPGMNPTPGVGTVDGDAKPFKPQKEITEDKDDDDDKDREDEAEQAGDPQDKSPETVKEDSTADEENKRQYDKIKLGDKQEKLKNLKECSCGTCASCENKSNIKEDVDALFAGEKLTPSFKKKASAIFETAVNFRVNTIVETEVDRLMQEYGQAVEEIKTELTEKVDQYLDYVAKEWLTENAIAIDNNIKNELVEDFLVGLKNLFTENYIDVPADKVNVVEALAEKVEELESNLNKQIETNVSLKEEVDSLKKYKLISETVKGLTEAASDKFIQLAEGIDFKDEKSYSESLTVLKENQIIKPKKSQNLTEDSNVDTIEQPGKSEKGDLKNVLAALKKTSR